MGLFAVACTTGGGGNTNPSPMGEKCTATFTTSGSFAPDAAHPAPTGWATCWPVGMWTFTVAQTANDCNTNPMVLQQYQMQGTQVLDENGDPNYALSYVTDPTAHFIAKSSSGGQNSQCEGELDIYSADGTQVWYWSPDVNADNSIGGAGMYILYESDQWAGQGGM